MVFPALVVATFKLAPSAPLISRPASATSILVSLVKASYLMYLVLSFNTSIASLFKPICSKSFTPNRLSPNAILELDANLTSPSTVRSAHTKASPLTSNMSATSTTSLSITNLSPGLMVVWISPLTSFTAALR